jgi:4-hydroxybutyrate CoA-transferase
MRTRRAALTAALLAALIAIPTSGRAMPATRFAPTLSARLGVTPSATPRLRLLDGRPADAPLLIADASTVQSIERRDTSRWRQGRLAPVVRALTHRPKVVDLKTAASLISAGDHVFVPVGQVASDAIIRALAERAKTPQGGLSADKPVEIVSLSTTLPRSIFDREGKIVPRALFLGGNARDSVAAGRGAFVPAYFGRMPRMVREGKVPVDVVVVQVSPPDKLGFVTLGPTAGVVPAALEKAKVVIAQVNKDLPRTYGDTRIHISKLDYVVKADAPLTPVPPAEITDTDRQIAKHVVKLVVDGQTKRGVIGRAVNKIKNAFGCGDLPTFQFGIGGIPDAVAAELGASRELSACKIRSELIGPGTQKLVESGKVKGKVVYTFAMGEQPFLKWMDRNSKLQGRAVDYVNDPSRIGKVKQMVAVNSAFKVDLLGQVNAQYIGGEWYSGVGGQVDFMRGAMTSQNGRAIIALPSTASISDGKGGRKLVSKIVARLGDEDVITTNMHDVQYVVTEHGVAALEGKSDVERARALIAVAHPDFRAELTASLESQIARRRDQEQRRYDKFKAQAAATSSSSN